MADDGVPRAAPPIQQADTPSESVTSAWDRNRERKRLQRARQQQPIVYERDDWQVFLDPETLPQKAGCQPSELAALVLKELIDNALDAGANITLTQSANGAHWIVADDGPGLDSVQVPELFAVNRPLRSSKLKRLPARGMLGNGLRVVMAWARTLTVETRGVRLVLEVDATTGRTTVQHREDFPAVPGLTVILPSADECDDRLARTTLALAEHGAGYNGPSLPHWYGQQDLARLFKAAPANATAAAVIRDLGLTPCDGLDNVRAHDLDHDAVGMVLRALQRQTKPIKPERIGHLGNVYAEHQGYVRKAGTVIEPAGGHVPYVIEASVRCELSAKKGAGNVRYGLTLNRSATVARLYGTSRPDYLSAEGCGLDLALRVPTGDYQVRLSLITPHAQLTSDGKSPSLAAYESAIEDVIYKAARQAHARAARPERAMSIIDAAWQVMPQAYLAASANNTLPANARQIMYAARPDILQLTGKTQFTDHYFTQTLLPDYLEAHPEETTDWDVVFDQRGTFFEPHTGHAVPLGTLAVRGYLGARQRPERPAALDPGAMAETVGPRHRYRDVLFIEKEGFTALLEHAQLAERFDLAVMSTKGMSVTAARMLLDGLAQRGVERVFVLHDFDASGFSIFGTLGTSSRRYRFENAVQLVDLGLRLADIEALGLKSESYSPENWDKRVGTLQRHGATPREIEFLRTRRVELNAMTSDVFVRFIEQKLAGHGVRKLLPDRAVLDRHAREVLTRALLNRQLDAMREWIEADAASLALPADLSEQVEARLREQPVLPWDLAVAAIIRWQLGDGK